MLILTVLREIPTEEDVQDLCRPALCAYAITIFQQVLQLLTDLFVMVLHLANFDCAMRSCVSSHSFVLPRGHGAREERCCVLFPTAVFI